MEMFRSVGVEEAIRQVEPPVPQDNNVPLVECLVGQEFDVLQEDISGLFSGPVPGSGIAQDVLEPVLRARAEHLGGDLRFGTKLVTFEQNEDGVTATIREHASGNTRVICYQKLVAADGSHSGIRQRLGIGTHGAESLFYCISTLAELPRFPRLGVLFRQTAPGQAMNYLLTLLHNGQANEVIRENKDLETVGRMMLGTLLTFAIFDGLLVEN